MGLLENVRLPMWLALYFLWVELQSESLCHWIEERLRRRRKF